MRSSTPLVPPKSAIGAPYHADGISHSHNHIFKIFGETGDHIAPVFSYHRHILNAYAACGNAFPRSRVVESRLNGNDITFLKDISPRRKTRRLMYINTDSMPEAMDESFGPRVPHVCLISQRFQMLRRRGMNCGTVRSGANHADRSLLRTPHRFIHMRIPECRLAFEYGAAHVRIIMAIARDRKYIYDNRFVRLKHPPPYAVRIGCLHAACDNRA